MTNYGKIDVLWYDVDWPLTAEQWEAQKMNDMVFQLQPDIIVNNRNGLPGDFSTPEQEIRAATKGRAWEACMTLNDSWGYHKADSNWKTPATVVNNLINCAHGGGNYLLNIGPKPDGSIPQESIDILQSVGKWTHQNGEAIYGTSAWKQPYQWSEGKQPQKSDKSFMAGYDIAKLIKPKQNEAHIEYFFTKKGDDLYCIVPTYTPQVRIHDLKISATTKATVLGGKTFSCKQDGNDCVIDLSNAEPGEIPAEMFVVKVSGVE